MNIQLRAGKAIRPFSSGICLSLDHYRIQSGDGQSTDGDGVPFLVALQGEHEFRPKARVQSAASDSGPAARGLRQGGSINREHGSRRLVRAKMVNGKHPGPSGHQPQISAPFEVLSCFAVRTSTPRGSRSRRTSPTGRLRRRARHPRWRPAGQRGNSSSELVTSISSGVDTMGGPSSDETRKAAGSGTAVTPLDLSLAGIILACYFDQSHRRAAAEELVAWVSNVGLSGRVVTSGAMLWNGGQQGRPRLARYRCRYSSSCGSAAAADSPPLWRRRAEPVFRARPELDDLRVHGTGAGVQDALRRLRRVLGPRARSSPPSTPHHRCQPCLQRRAHRGRPVAFPARVPPTSLVSMRSASPGPLMIASARSAGAFTAPAGMPCWRSTCR